MTRRFILVQNDNPILLGFRLCFGFRPEIIHRFGGENTGAGAENHSDCQDDGQYGEGVFLCVCHKNLAF